MDIMSIGNTKFMRMIVKTIVQKIIKSKIGMDVELDLDNLEVSVLDEKDTVDAKASVRLKIKKEDIKHIVDEMK